MLSSIELTGVKYEIDDNTKRYVSRKIGRLDKYVSRHARKSMQATVVLRYVNRARGNTYECDVTISLPEATINAKDTTMNMLAAIDIVEAKLLSQLHRYKEEHLQRKRGAVIAKIGRRLRRK